MHASIPVPGRPLAIAAALLLTITPLLRAQDSTSSAPAAPAAGATPAAGLSGLTVHGFATWSYGKTNGNEFLAGDGVGSYRDQSFALNLSARLSDRLRVVSQLAWESGDGGASKIDYAFAEWRVRDRLALRVGQVQHPFGIYGEIQDVGTLRPFIELPQAVYGATAFTGTAFKGIGITGRRVGNWSLDYDLYAGGLEEADDIVGISYFEVGPDYQGARAATEAASIEVTNEVVGGRLVVETPLDGLSVGTSAYTGTIAGETPTVRRAVVGVHANYLTDTRLLRGEVVREDEAGGERSIGAYVEGAYHVTPQWQLAASASAFRTTLPPELDLSAASSLLTHHEASLGINYWFDTDLVLKLSVHDVTGNRFARPEAEVLASSIRDGTLARRTRLVLLGAQFSF